MFNKLLSLGILIFKTYLAIKVLFWCYYRLNNPGLHPIEEIDWVLVVLLLDTWIVSHTKIEITGFLERKND
jgi:hypothetical protein